MLKITGVSRRFGDVTALSDVSLEIRQGEFFALLGPSGCGKTTLLRILAGFESPDEGSVTLDGDDLLGQAAHRRPVNLMFQSYALFPHMTVAKNVAYGLERSGWAGRRSAAGSARCWRRSGWTPWPGANRSSCPAASGSGSRWPARS